MASSGSSKKVVPKYIKFIMLQKISECKRSVYFLRGEIRHAIMNIDQLNGLIEMMEVMEFTLELYDSVWCLRDMVKAENKRLLGLNKHLVDAEEDIRAKEGYLEILEEAIYSHDMPIIDEVVFKIHKKGVFAFDPLRTWFEVNTDNDVHSFFANAELNEEDAGLRCYSSSPFTTRIKKRGGNISRKGKEIRYELPKCTPTKDDTLRCSSSTPISIKLKRNSSKKIKEGLRKKGKAVGRTLIDSCDKGKEKVDEFPAATPTKEHQVVVTNYKRATVNGKAKMVEVVAPVEENVDVAIKQEDRRRKIVLGSMAPANFLKNPVVSPSMGQGSSVKQHEVHANENRTMMERFLQPTNDPLALVSNASVQQYPTQSSKSPQPSNEPSPADKFQLDSGSSSTENLIESLSNSLALLTQSYKSHLPQTNNQLRTHLMQEQSYRFKTARVCDQDVS
ncbi:hypothetical protein Tco_0706152 [Tanacetum coccineum]|uniref:Uncharacterized protein n=1 Tax=Tanacetum coccineum TaxID=301880 RepID=A0ABQ4Y7J0_9ASTR